MVLQVFEGRVIRGDPTQCGHIIQATAGSGASRQVINYSTERVVGNGSFGVVFQATCLETGETVRVYMSQDTKGCRVQGQATAPLAWYTRLLP